MTLGLQVRMYIGPPPGSALDLSSHHCPLLSTTAQQCVQSLLVSDPHADSIDMYIRYLHT